MSTLVPGTTNHASASSGAVSVNTPSTTVYDTLIAFVVTQNAATGFTPTQSGWTTIPGGSTPTSGNSGAGLFILTRQVTSNDPSSWTFTPSTGVISVGITAIPNAYPGGPADMVSVSNWNTNNYQTPQTTPSSNNVPDVIGTLPIAVFCAADTQTAASVISNGWTRLYEEDRYSTGHEYAGVIAAYGPLTTDTSTAISASCSWPQYTNTTGVTALLLVKPSQPQTITISPSTFSIPNPGQTQSLAVTQNGTNALINVVSSNSAVFTVSPSSFYGPSATITVTGVGSGTAVVTVTGP